MRLYMRVQRLRRGSPATKIDIISTLSRELQTGPRVALRTGPIFLPLFHIFIVSRAMFNITNSVNWCKQCRKICQKQCRKICQDFFFGVHILGYCVLFWLERWSRKTDQTKHNCKIVFLVWSSENWKIRTMFSAIVAKHYLYLDWKGKRTFSCTLSVLAKTNFQYFSPTQKTL